MWRPPQAQGVGCGAELAIPHNESVPIDELEFRCQPFRAQGGARAAAAPGVRLWRARLAVATARVCTVLIHPLELNSRVFTASSSRRTVLLDTPRSKCSTRQLRLVDVVVRLVRSRKL